MDLYSGAKIESVEDLRITLPGADFVITRQYTSLQTSGTVWPLGEGWSLSVFNSIRTDMSGPGSTERIILRGLPLNQTSVYEQVSGSSPTTWRASPRGQEYFQQTTLTANILDLSSNTYTNASRGVWRLTYPGVSTVDFYRNDGTSTPPSLVGLIAQEADVYGNTRIYDYQLFGPSSGTQVPKLVRIRCYSGGASASGVPIAEVYFNWNLYPETYSSVNSRVRLGRLASMTAVRYFEEGGQTWVNPTNAVGYRYFQPTTVLDPDDNVVRPAHHTSVGTAGDLVQVRYSDSPDPNPAATDLQDWVRVQQYRYFGGASASVNGETITGGAHQLKAAINPEQIEYAAAALATTLDDEWLDTFADSLLVLADADEITGFEGDRPVLDLAAKVVSYNTSGAHNKKVQTQYLQNGCACSGAAQSVKNSYAYYTYEWGTSSLDGATCKVVEAYKTSSGYTTLRTEYSDFKQLTATSGPYLINHAIVSNIAGLAQRWVTQYDYSSTTRNLTRVVTPAAVDHYYAIDETGGSTSSGSIRPSTAVGLKASEGLVHHYGYTADHWLTSESVSKGVSTTPVTVLVVTYPSSPTTNQRKWLPTSIEAYTDSASTAEETKQTTTLAYTFHSGDAIASTSWIVEAESQDEGGPGGTLSSTCLFGANGQLQWVRMFDGALIHIGRESTTGQAVLVVANANPSGQTGVYPALSGSSYGGITVDSSWGRYSSGGSLSWTHTVNPRGQRTSTTEPDGSTSYLHRAMQVDSLRGGNFYYYTVTGLPPQIPGSPATASGPAHVTWISASGSVLRESDFLISSGYDPGAGTFTISSTETSRSASFLNLGGNLTSDQRWYDIANNLSYSNTYEYDDAGRVSYITDANGTITHIPGNGLDSNSNPLNGYDALGRVLIREVGTSKSPANFTRLAEFYYDDTDGDSTLEQGIGNGNLTHVRLFTGETSSAYGPSSRTITRTYNYRDELIRMVGPSAPYAELDYDNLGRLRRAGLFTSATSGDEPSAVRATTSSTRGKYIELSYSQRGLPYRSAIAVDPTDLGDGFIEQRSWYDPSGRIIEKWTPGRPAVKRDYDGLGRVTSVFLTDRNNDSITGSTAYASAANRTDDTVFEQVNRTFDSLGRLSIVAHLQRIHDSAHTGDLTISASTPNAVTTYRGYAYDAAGRTLGSVYFGTNDTSNDFLKSGGSAPSALSAVPSRADSAFAHAIINSVTYNSRDQVESVIDPMGRVTKYFYDDLDRPFAVVENHVSDPTFTFSSGHWNVTGSITADENRTTSYVYDGLDQVTMQAAHLPPVSSVAQAQVTKYVYSYYHSHGSSHTVGSPSSSTATLAAVNDLLYEVWFPDRSTGEPSSSNKITYAYNALGEPRSVTDQNGTRHVYTRDASGRPIRDKVEAFGTNIDNYVGAIEAVYDTLGRLDRITSLSSDTTPVKRNQVRFRYNSLGQISRLYQDNDGEVESSGDDGAPLNSTTVLQYGYDTQTLSAGNYTRLASMTYPSGAVYTTGYGANTTANHRVGRPVKYTLGSTDLLEYSYLGFGTTVLAQFPQIDVDLDRTIKPSGHRRTSSVTSGVQGEYHGFDRLGRLIRQYWVDSDITNGGGAYPTRPQIFAEEYTYDRNSNRTGRRDARPGAVIGNRDSRFEYDGLKRLKEAKRGVDSISSFTSGKGSQRWTLDTLGNWAEFESDLAPNSTTGNFGTYNDATGDLHETRAHNRNNEATGRVPNTNVSSTSLPFNYDPAGNLRSYTLENTGTRTLTHDAWNRLVNVTELGSSGSMSWYGSWDHRYNGLGWRITTGTALGGLTREMRYSAAWRLLEEEVSDGGEFGSTPLRRVERFWGQRYIDDQVASRVTPYVLVGSTYQEGTPQLYYHLTDAQFSTVATLDANAKVVERVSYDAYGNPRHRWPGDFDGDGDQDNDHDAAAFASIAEAYLGDETYVAEMDINRDGVMDHQDPDAFGTFTVKVAIGGISSSGPDNSIGYCGYVIDPTTGWYLARNRWYAPELGRWVERDPIGYIDGANLYEYVTGNPLRFVDPYGLWGETWAQDLVNAGWPRAGQALGAAGGALEGAATGAWNMVEGAGKSVVEAGAIIVDGAGMLTDLAALEVLDKNLGYEAISEWGKRQEHGGSWGEVGEDTLNFAGRGAAAMVTRGGSEVLINVWQHHDIDNPDDMDALSESMGSIVFWNTLAHNARYAGQAKGQGQSVARWGQEGLRSGDWVMSGGKNILNFMLSGKMFDRGLFRVAEMYRTGRTYRLTEGQKVGLYPGLWGKIAYFFFGHRQVRCPDPATPKPQPTEGR